MDRKNRVIGETSEDGTYEMTESNLEELILVIFIYSSKAGFRTVSLTYHVYSFYYNCAFVRILNLYPANVENWASS
jgi:hypothetical protein